MRRVQMVVVCLLAGVLVGVLAAANPDVYAIFTAPGSVVQPVEETVRFSAAVRRAGGISRVVVALPDGTYVYTYRAPYPTLLTYPKLVWQTAGYSDGMYAAKITAYAAESRTPFAATVWQGELRR